MKEYLPKNPNEYNLDGKRFIEKIRFCNCYEKRGDTYLLDCRIHQRGMRVYEYRKNSLFISGYLKNVVLWLSEDARNDVNAALKAFDGKVERMKEEQPVSFSVGGHDCRIYYRGERGCPCEYYFEYEKDGKVWQNFYKYDPLHRLLCDAADLLEMKDDHTHTVFVCASEETIDENPIYRAALAQGDLLFAKLLKLHYGIADGAECSALQEHFGFRILPSLPQELDRDYTIDADTINYKLLSDSGYMILHRPYFGMKDSTHAKWKINPHTKSGVNAAPITMTSIPFAEFLKLFDNEPKSGVGSAQKRYRELTVENLARITKGIEKKGYAFLDTSEDGRRELQDALVRKGYSYLPVFLFQKNQTSAAPSGQFLVVFPYDCRNRKYAVPDAFERDMTALSGKMGENDTSNSPVRIANTPKELFTAILNQCNDGSEEETICYIQTPPSSIQVGHSHWSNGNLNHIYNEETV